MMNWLSKTKQRVKFEGKYNFELQINTQFVDSSSNLSITCFTDKTLKAALPCSYIWFIIKNGLPFEIQGFKGSTFICDTSHIGYYIQVHIISNDSEYNGKAIATFGPVQLDVSLKTNILQGLSRGKLTLPVYLVSPKQQQKESTLQLMENEITLIHNFSDLSYSFDYSILQPMITPHTKEVHKISILFNEKYQSQMRVFENKLFNDLYASKKSVNTVRSANTGANYNPNQSSSSAKLDIKFLSRSARDTFLFCMKSFIVKRQMKNAAIIRKIESINFEKEEQFGVIQEMDNLKRDLIRYDRMFKQAVSQKKICQDDLSRMEKQIQSLRNSKAHSEYQMQHQHPYQPMQSNYQLGYNQPLQNAPRKDDHLLIMRNEHLEKQNHQLNVKIRNMYNEIDFIKNSRILPNLKPISPVTSSSINPFSKKKQSQNESLVNLLDDLNKSDQYFTHAQHDNAIEKMQAEKQALQLKLQKSFQHIDLLQKKLHKVNIPGSSINFTYQLGAQGRIIQKLKMQLQECKKVNEKLKIQNKQLLAQHQSKQNDQSSKIDSHLINIRNINKSTNLVAQIPSKEIQALKLQIASKDKKLKEAHIKIEEMTKNRTILEENCIRWERRAKEIQSQMQIYRRNQDVLNRSQNMSMQMQNYTQEQIRILKEHNEFLVNENQKLVKACQKYIIDAKQNNKLRQEIIQLKEKLNNLKTNPQHSNSYIS